jgi:glycine cleavage system H protein
MENQQFTEDHEWVCADGDCFVIGISKYAVDELGEIVYVELPEIGSLVTKGDEFGSVESVKTVSGIYSPISGTVVSVNADLINAPEQINQSPYEDGWLIKVSPDPHTVADDMQSLMSYDDYKRFIDTL